MTPWLTPQEQERAKKLLQAKRYLWSTKARPQQLAPPGDWQTWLILAGRGFGKTRTGAEWVRSVVRDFPLVNLIGATADDARDIMIEGESGILAVCPPWFRPVYKKSDRQLQWPNGARSLIFTADEPDRLRGKQHMKLWADELGSWRYEEAWDQAMLGLRLGANPQAVVTTTPRPTKLIKDLIGNASTHVTHGSTHDNRPNLAPAFFERVIKKYEGTRLGRQELNAEVLDDNPNALWTRARIDELRVTKHPELKRVVVAIDPAVTSGEDAAETGIVVAGLGVDGHGYVLDDVSMTQATPKAWSSQAIAAYHKHRADRIVGEVNNGGEMIEHTLRTVEKGISYKALHATRGKQLRAEPVSALYEKGEVHHVGAFSQLEDEQCEWEPGMDSPNHLDALVWSITDLMLGGQSWEFKVV